MQKTSKNIKKQQQKKLIRLAAVTAGFAFLLVILVLLKSSAKVSRFMANNVSRRIIQVVGSFTSALPFSFYELFLYIAGIILVVFAVSLVTVFIKNICQIIKQRHKKTQFLLYEFIFYLTGIALINGFLALIILLFRKNQIKTLKIITKILLVALIFGNIYFVSAAFSYNRYDEYFPTLLLELSYEELTTVTEFFVDDFLQIHASLDKDKYNCAIMPYSKSQLADKLRTEFNRLNGYNINPYTPKAKILYSSTIMSEMGFSGVFFAPFGEAIINGQIPDFSLPHTMAHELAHAKGVMREEEANQVATYITVTSTDPFIRYSGYINSLSTFLDALYTFERAKGLNGFPQFNRLDNKINDIVYNEYLQSGRFWSSHTKLRSFFSSFNDFYLKLMGQKEGTKAYNPPDTPIVDKPVPDPDTGGVVTDPDTGGVVTEFSPEYNIVQQIFFWAYKDRALAQ